MRRILLSLGIALLAGGALGCVRHLHHHHPKTVHRAVPHETASLEREHDDQAVVILHERPGPHRKCWKHRRHWHCRVR